MKRCKQLASSLAKEEEAQTQQVTPAVTCIIAVTTAINIKGGGGRWERLVYYCGEKNLCTPSPREQIKPPPFRNLIL